MRSAEQTGDPSSKAGGVQGKPLGGQSCRWPAQQSLTCAHGLLAATLTSRLAHGVLLCEFITENTRHRAHACFFAAYTLTLWTRKDRLLPLLTALHPGTI